MHQEAEAQPIKQSEHRTPSHMQPRKPVPPEALEARIGCNCRRSKCLKLYCDCFAADKNCGPHCQCQGCENTDARASVMRKSLIEKRNSQTALMTDEGGLRCTCKKSRCAKKYCVCFQRGDECSAQCKCNDCKNGKPTQPTQPTQPTLASEPIVQPPTNQQDATGTCAWVNGCPEWSCEQTSPTTARMDNAAPKRRERSELEIRSCSPKRRKCSKHVKCLDPKPTCAHRQLIFTEATETSTFELEWCNQLICAGYDAWC